MSNFKEPDVPCRIMETRNCVEYVRSEQGLIIGIHNAYEPCPAKCQRFEVNE